MLQFSSESIVILSTSKDFIMLGLASGARRGELLALQWPDIDFETGLMSVTKSLSQTKAGLRVKSTKSRRPRDSRCRPPRSKLTN
jgi:integrase